MKFLRSVEPTTWADRSDLTKVDEGLFSTRDGEGLVVLEYVLEDGEDDQYPLESVLERFMTALEFDAMDPQPAGSTSEPTVADGVVEVFTGDLDDVRAMRDQLVGHRAYEVEHDGNLRLVIE